MWVYVRDLRASRWFFVDAFPLTTSGKIQKFALREGWENGDYREEAE